MLVEEKSKKGLALQSNFSKIKAKFRKGELMA